MLWIITTSTTLQYLNKTIDGLKESIMRKWIAYLWSSHDKVPIMVWQFHANSVANIFSAWLLIIHMHKCAIIRLRLVCTLALFGVVSVFIWDGPKKWLCKWEVVFAWVTHLVHGTRWVNGKSFWWLGGCIY